MHAQMMIENRKARILASGWTHAKRRLTATDATILPR